MIYSLAMVVLEDKHGKSLREVRQQMDRGIIEVDSTNETSSSLVGA